MTAVATSFPGRTREAAQARAISPAQRAVGLVLAAVAGAAVWVVVFALGLSALVEHHDQRVLYSALRERLANQSAPVTAPYGRGQPVALLQGPHLGSLVVVAGTTSAELRAGPGLSPSSPLPGQPGESSILGRGSTYGGPFGHVGQLGYGDVVTVTTGQAVNAYEVVANVRAGGQVPPAYLAARSKLRLVTSTSSDFLGVPTPGTTRYVYLVLTSDVQDSGGRGQSTADDLPNAVHPAGLYPLVLWLQLLLVVVLAATWVLVRGPRRLRPHTWLLAVPIGLAALFGASGALFGVLPNLL